MKSLYVKFVATTIAIMLISGLLAFLFSNTYYQYKLKPQNDAKNTKIALEIAEYIKENDGINIQRYLNNVASLGYQLLLIDTFENETYFGAPFRETSLRNEMKQKVLDGEVYHGMLQFPKETFVTGFFANELSNTVGVPVEENGKRYALFLRPDIKLLFNEIHVLLAWLLAGTMLLSIGLVLVGTKFLVHPISKLTKATNKLSKGDFVVQLDIERNDEIGELATSFTRMVKHLESLDEMKTEFISNITHDIQSPLANLKGYVNLLEKNNLASEEKQHYVSTMYSEIDRLSRLTKQLLLLASLDQNEGLVNKKCFNVSEQLKEVLHRYQWMLNERGIMLSYSLPDVFINGDPSLLTNVWENVLTNAIKYNKENGTIELSVREIGDMIEMEIQDTGIGFKEHEIDRAFERFYRVDESRTSSVEGTGLGLSIAQSIVKLHGGSIQIKSVVDEGTTVNIHLPKTM